MDVEIEATSGTARYVGGIAGSLNYSSIENCYVLGKVSGARYVGGVAGYMAAANSIVRNCYSSAAVSATNGDVGGVVGYMVGNAAGVLVENCYSSGYVSGSTKDTFCQGSFLLK